MEMRYLQDEASSEKRQVGITTSLSTKGILSFVKLLHTPYKTEKEKLPETCSIPTLQILQALKRRCKAPGKPLKITAAGNFLT